MTAADQIRALADTGTPADRWRIRQGRDGSNWIEAGEYDEVLQPAPVSCMAYCYGGSSQIELSDEDAAKIVAAVNALPKVADDQEAHERLRRACRELIEVRLRRDATVAGQVAEAKAWDTLALALDACDTTGDALVAALGVKP